MFKVQIHDRNCTSWSFYETISFKKVELEIHPMDHQLMSNDVFNLDKDNKVVIVHSSVRMNTCIPGVLVLKSNKTYGRKNGKLLYKCIPDDIRVPSFLIPYEIKHVGFSKVFMNMYVTFSYTDWKGKHPEGVLNQVIGSVDVPANFYEYLLYCKSLNASIQKFTKDATRAVKEEDAISAKYPCMEDRTQWTIFTIDPPKSADFDDAFSIKLLDTGVQQLSVYISNVTIWMDSLNLWDSFSQRISTIYLPDRKRPMLPTILSDCLCSLQENTERFAFVMDVFIQNQKEKGKEKGESEIIDIKYSNCKIKVAKNYCYEESSLLLNKDYLHLFEVTKQLSRKFKYINSIKNSHDLVSYLMILMNYQCAKELFAKKNGIFRSVTVVEKNEIPENLDEEVVKFIKIWNSSAGQYVEHGGARHELLDMDAYVHITSPIRRLVDLLNIIKFQKNNGMIELSENSEKFYDKWILELDYINTTMRSVRKVQNECTMLELCMKHPEKTYEGYAFDKICRSDGLYQYIVFLPDIKLTSKITARYNMENYEKKRYKIYLFSDEEHLKKKIRLQIVDQN